MNTDERGFHELAGDRSIFRREDAFGENIVGRKHGPVPFRDVCSRCSACLRFCVRFLGTPLVVLLLALLIRGGLLLVVPDALVEDPDGYRQLAENLVEHGTFGKGDAPTAYRPPLYPLLLTGCVALGEYGRVAIGVLHVLLGVATVGLTLVLGRWWGLGNRGAAVAALLVACDPILLGQSAQVMTETLAAFLATAGLCALTILVHRCGRNSEFSGRRYVGHEQVDEADVPSAAKRPAAETNGNDVLGRRSNDCRRMALLAGAILAFGALCRPTLLLWTIAVGVAWIARRRKALGAPLAFILGVLLVLSPWAIRNQLQFGRPIVTTTHGGYTLLLANNPDFYQWLRSGRWGSVWSADRFNADWNRRKPPGELQADRLAYAEAWQNIRREPRAFAHACLVRLGRFWSPLPHRVVPNETPLRRMARYAVAVWYLAEFLLAIVFVCRLSPLLSGEGSGVRAKTNVRPSTPASPIWLWGLLLVACLTAVHAVFWTNMRMRAPIMSVVALAAAAALGRKPNAISRGESRTKIKPEKGR